VEYKKGKRDLYPEW